MLPNLVVIGAMKCGTSSLHYYLHQHPEISMAREKELDFFIRELNWRKGIEWYESKFTGEAKIHGETSPGYTNPSFDGVPERMHRVIPEARLVYILRDPIDRLISHYSDLYATRHEDRELSDALRDLDDNPYVAQSRYYTQLQGYLDYYARDRILIITLEDLRRDPRQTMGETFRFLEVDSAFYSTSFTSVKNPSRRKRRLSRFGHFLARAGGLRIAALFPSEIRQSSRILFSLPVSHRMEAFVLSDDLREALIGSLKDDVDRLREFTGKGFESWCL